MTQHVPGDAHVSGLKADSRTYWRLLRYLRPHLLLLFGGLIATLLFAALDAFSYLMLLPFLKMLFTHDAPINFSKFGHSVGPFLQKLASFIGTEATPRTLFRLNVLILLIFFLKNFADFIQSIFSVKLEQAVVRDMRNQVYRHLIELDLRFFHRTRAGQIITRLTSDMDQVRLLLTRNLLKVLTAAFQVVIAIVLMVKLSGRLTLLSIIVLPVLFGVWGRMLRRLKRGDRTVMALGSDVTSHLQETVSGIRQVKAAAAEPFEVRRFAALVQSYYKAVVRTERVRAVAGPLSEVIGAFGTMLLLWYGGNLVISNQLDGIAFIGFLAFSLKLYQPAKFLSKFPSQAGPALVAGERVFEFLDTPLEMQATRESRTFQDVHDALRFENVSFAYDVGEAVLDDVSFEVPAGTVVALVGPSGAGKTTMVDLVARFYDPTDGRISIDGIDLRDFDVKSLRARMGVVTQETVLFHDTVRANIAYAAPDAPAADVERAARAANAHEFIMQLPNGYDTLLGERGTRLSGGQRQRIAIARAILRDPPILIFDEATSALDSESERLVQEAIETLLEGRTVFVIAHRLSTIRRADQILVLREGRIVEQGPHDTLISLGGTYRRLYDLQFATS